MKLQNNQGQYRITLPKDVVKAKGWDQGTELIIFMNSEGELVIKEIRGGKSKK